MAATFTFTADNVGNPENVVIQTVCYRVKIYENNQANTTDYKGRRPITSTTPITKAAGETWTFEAPPGKQFYPGDIPASIETVTGSATFAQEEE